MPLSTGFVGWATTFCPGWPSLRTGGGAFRLQAGFSFRPIANKLEDLNPKISLEGFDEAHDCSFLLIPAYSGYLVAYSLSNSLQIQCYAGSIPGEWRNQSDFCDQIVEYLREAREERETLIQFIKHLLR
jgi:hypothetical protein